jgi:hypothetical protein
MGRPPRGGSIERKNNDGNYEPLNCKWAMRREQSRNKRNNRLLSFNGEVMCLTDWAARLGMDQGSLRERLESWPVEKALSTPPKKTKRRN